MNASTITIPQVFYDLIARVLPGFFFCSLLSIYFPSFTPINSDFQSFNGNLAIVFFKAVEAVFIFYFVGLFLQSIVIRSHRERIIRRFQKDEVLPLYNQYQEIRIQDQAIGFRILKLRAEARMLEASRMAALIIAIMTICINIYFYVATKAHLISLQETLKIGVLIWIFFVFHRAEKKYWSKYCRNIRGCYLLLFEKKNDLRQKELQRMKNGSQTDHT